MTRAFRFLCAVLGASTFAVFTHIAAASATTLALPDGSSNATFSIQSASPYTLAIGPVVTVNTNGCPSFHCTNSYWNVGITVDFFSATNGLLTSDNVNVFEDCNPSGCTVPSIAFLSVPVGSTEFEIFNDVNVGGGWTYNYASEFITAEGSQIAETPIPDAAFLFAAGLSVLGLLIWRRRGEMIRVSN